MNQGAFRKKSNKTNSGSLAPILIAQDNHSMYEVTSMKTEEAIAQKNMNNERFGNIICSKNDLKEATPSFTPLEQTIVELDDQVKHQFQSSDGPLQGQAVNEIQIDDTNRNLIESKQISVHLDDEEKDILTKMQKNQSYGYKKSQKLDLKKISSVLDKETVFDGINQITAKQNKELYMKNYTIQFEIGNQYVQSSKIFIMDPAYCFQLINYVIPENQDIKVFTIHNNENDYSQSNYRDIYSGFYEGVILRLVKWEGSKLEKQQEVVLCDHHNAIIKFSKDGKMFAIYCKHNGDIKIYTGYKDAKVLFEMIKSKSYLKCHRDSTLDIIESISFDNNDNFLVCASKKQIFILGIYSEVRETHTLDQHRYQRILDHVAISDDKDNYVCYIAAQKKNVKQICVFDIQNEEKTIKILNFFTEPTKYLKVAISDDFSEVVFVNNGENILLSFNRGVVIQKILPQLQNKIVLYIHKNKDNKGFYFVASYEYDPDLDIQSSLQNDFSIAIPRQIEPGIIKIFDFDLLEVDNKFELRVLSLDDDDFVYDLVTYQNKGTNDSSSLFDVKYQSKHQFSVSGFSLCWPFFAYSGTNDYLTIHSVFEKNVIFRIKLTDDDNDRIVKTFITNSKDLIAVVKTEKKYKVYFIDLDQLGKNNPFQKVLLFSYFQSKVKNAELLQIYARGSTRKQRIDLNNKLMIFFLHGTEIHKWTQFGTTWGTQSLLNFVSTTCSQEFYILNSNCFFFMNQTDEKYMQNAKIGQTQQIIQCDIFFSYCSLNPIFEIDSFNERILQFNVDQGQKKLIILSQKDSEKRFKIYNLTSKLVEIESVLEFQPLIGRLESGLYTFVDGHIYYNNNVIKIRYDLFNNSGINYKENEIFDFYFDIFELSEGERVKAKTPLDSFENHKLAYIVSNKESFTTQKIIMMPYLHENKIYLNRTKDYNDYFYTSIETNIEDEENETGTNTLTSIICINLTESKYSVYSQNGLLINKFDFQNEIQQYGQILCSSSNGQCHVFKKSISQITKKDSDEHLDLHIMKISIFGIRQVKTINIQKLFQNITKGKVKSWLDNFDFKKQLKELSIKCHINDNFGILVELNQVKNIQQNTEQSTTETFETELESIYLFQSGKNGLQIDKDQMDEQEYKNIMTYIDNKEKRNIDYFIYKSNKDHHCLISNNFFVCYNDKTIKYWNLKKGPQNSMATIAKFQIDQDFPAFIKDVSVSSNSEVLSIFVNQSVEMDSLYIWNLEKNIEQDGWDLGKEYQVLQDYTGNLYIIDSHKVYFTKQNCTLTAFKINEQDIQKTNKEQNQLGGHRFDGKNHNWLMMKEYLCLPFSYMTFVIKDKIEQNDPLQKGNIFDPDPYNYIFNKSTCFLESQFTRDDHVQLKDILVNLEKYDPCLIDLLLYVQEIKKNDQVVMNSALNVAYESDNNRGIDIILTFMAKSNNSNSLNFKHLFSILQSRETFWHYLKELTYQTVNMEIKQNLKVRYPFSSQIVSFGSSNCNYMDSRQFATILNEELENKESHFFPVQIKALRIDWILNTSHGKDFLASILTSEDLDHYSVDTCQMIVEFLFYRFQSYIYQRQFYTFMMEIIILFTIMLINEQVHHNDVLMLGDIEFDLSEMMSDETKKQYHIALSVCASVLLLINLQNVWLQFERIRYDPRAYVRRLNSYLDLSTIILLFVQMYWLMSHLYSDDQSKQEMDQRILYMRNISTVVIFLQIQRFLGFLSLNKRFAQIIDAFYKIVDDIKEFVFVFCILIACFAYCFWLQNANQVEFDDLTALELSKLRFKTPLQAAFSIYLMVLGDFSTANFEYGQMGQKAILYILFIVSSFTMTIHLLNMLIAIMGNTFNKRVEVAEQVQVREHLKFIMDNWNLKKDVFKNQNDIKYLITAFSNNEPDEKSLILNEVQEEMKSQFTDIKIKLAQQQKLNNFQFQQLAKLIDAQNKVLKGVQTQKIYQLMKEDLKNKINQNNLFKVGRKSVDMGEKHSM